MLGLGGKMLRLYKIAGLAAVFSAGIIFAGGNARAQEVVVGAASVISGPFASYGADATTGIKLAVDEINGGGGILGHKVRVQFDDTSGDRAKAVALYRKYAAEPDMVAAMSISSPEFVALDPVAGEVKLPLISIGSTIPSDKFSPYTFRTNFILSKSIRPVLASLKKQGTSRIAILYDNGANYTVAEMEGVKTEAPKAGLGVVGVEAFTTGDQNFTLQLTRLVGQKPDMIWVAGMTDEAALIITQARAMEIKSKIIGGAGMNDPRIGALDDAAQEVMTYALFNSNDPRPQVINFVANFRKANNGQAPSAYNALGYDAMWLLADALKRAGAIDREALRAALAATKDFVGVDGPFRYEGSGDNLAQSPNLLIYSGKAFSPLTLD